jgi:hypothetical protein
MFRRALLVRVAALLPVIFSHSASTEAQERAYLDATQVPIRQRQREPATGSGGVIGSAREGQKPPPQPLTLILKIFGRSELTRGEVFEYEVQIRNASDRSIELPWDLSPADIEAADPHASYQYQTAAIFLHARLGDNRPVSLEGPILLFGSRSVTPTTLTLEPGEWVRIKAKGRAVSSNPNDAWPPADFTSKEVGGTLTATLIRSASSFTPGTASNSHEETRPIGEMISSNAPAIQFRF